MLINYVLILTSYFSNPGEVSWPVHLTVVTRPFASQASRIKLSVEMASNVLQLCQRQRVSDLVVDLHLFAVSCLVVFPVNY